MVEEVRQLADLGELIRHKPPHLFGLLVAPPLANLPHKWTKIAPDGLPAVRFVCDECLKACADAVKEAEPVTARGMPTFKDRKEIEAVLKVIRVSGLTSLWDAIGLVAENYESKSTNKVRRWLDLIDQNEARIAELTEALAAIPAE